MALDLRMERVASRFSEGVSALEPSRTELRERREALLQEPLSQRFSRITGLFGRALSPAHLRATLSALDLLVRDRSICAIDLPSPDAALSVPDGLCGLATDLSSETILDAYSRGLCLEGALGQPTWWAPSTRHVVTPGRVRVSGHARMLLHRRDMRVRFDRATDEVIATCARPRPEAGSLGYGPALTQTYVAMADAGLLHSVEVRDPGGRLAAGLIGLSLGSLFVIERAFGPADAIDLGLVILDRHLAAWNYGLIDARSRGEFARLGFVPLPRKDYQQRVLRLLNGGRRGRWQVEPDLAGLEVRSDGEAHRPA